MSQQTAHISLESRQLAEAVALAELEGQKSETRKALWLELAGQLEADGVPKEEVHAHIVRLVEKKMRLKAKDTVDGQKVKFNNSWFYVVMAEAGYTQELIPDREWQNTSRLNQSLIDGVFSIREVCNHIITSLATLSYKNKPVHIKEILDSRKLSIFETELTHIAAITEGIIDQKTKVPPNTQSIFKEIFRVESSMLAAARLFCDIQIKLLDRQRAWLTKKQANKFLKGSEPNMLEIYQPKTRDEAIFAGWVGIQCECGKWRMQPVIDSGANTRYGCVDCKATISRQTIYQCPSCYSKIYDADIKLIRKSRRCPECNIVLNLPDSITEGVAK